MSENGTLLPVGAQAPDFTARTSSGDAVTLSSLRGDRSVLLMFYPQDDTPGCTRQMCAARDEGADYAAAGVARFGVNPGSVESHQGFAGKYGLDFPLIVDEDRAIARAYGVLRDDGEVARATYVVGRDGRIAYAERGAHGAAEVLGAIGG
jgi:peroxiredoxin Q/BCP